MVTQVKKWIVRDDIGHIYGPFELGKLRDLLTKGILTGEEQTAQYPAGDWRPMSAEPELYNLILDSLSAEKKKTAVGEELLPPPRPEMQKTKSPADYEEEEKEAQKKRKAAEKKAERKAQEKVTSINKKRETQAQEAKKRELPKREMPPTSHLLSSPTTVIELTDKSHLVERFKAQSNIIPILLVLGAIVLFYIGSHYNDLTSRNVSINLLAPHPKQNGSQSRSDTFVSEGVSFFHKDTYTNYVRAEEDFVQAVEEAPGNVQALLMLILTDLELWPMTKQDSSDQAVVQSLIQMISKADVAGDRRAVASPAIEMTLGHDSVAKSQIDSALVKQPAEGFLYGLEGQIYFLGSDYTQAIAYYEKAATLGSAWVKPIYYLGLSYSKQGLGAQAQQYLIQALKMNPSHAGARLELGVVESRYFNHDEKAREFLTLALTGDERLPPFIEARGRITLSAILYRAGDIAEAKKQAQLAARLSPSDPDVTEMLARLGEKGGDGATVAGTGLDREHMALGDQYMRTGNYLGAQAQYKSAFASNPQNARAAMKTAEALWKLHQSTEAIDYLQKSIGADPRFIESYVLMADYKGRRYDFEGASRALEMALKKNSKNYEIYRGYGELELRRGNLDTAEINALRALQLYEIDLLSNELMSKIQLAKKDLVKALQYGKKAIDIDRGDPEAQVNYARVLAGYQGVKSASEYLRELIDLFPSQTDLRVGLADILVQDEQYGVAEQVLKQVVSAEENNKEAFLLLGDTQNASGNLNGALTSYLTAARIDPSDPTALFRAGELYLKSGKLADAQKQFLLVLRVNGLFPRAHYNLARAYFSSGMTEEALDQLEQEKKLNPRIADPYEFEGDIYLATRKFAAAVREYQRASEFRPLGASIYVKLAKGYRGQGYYDEAMAMLRLAAAKESGFSEIYREYGYIYDAKGLAPEAIGNFEKYLILEPNAPDKNVIDEKLKQLK